jgi:hypothetical protein
MNDPGSLTADAGLAVARRLASAQPQAMLPCPLCAAGVRGEHLEKHLVRIHSTPDRAGRAEVEWAEGIVWSGTSKRVPFIAFLALAAAILWTAGTRSGTVVVDARTELAVVSGLVVSFFALLAVAQSGAFRARLAFVRGSLRLRHGLGLGVRVVRLPARLEVGSLWERGGSSELHWASHEPSRRGSYLRIVDGARSITIHPAGTSAREFWALDGIRTGPKRYGYDLRLDAPAFVTLEYLLASRGMLSLRSG